MILCDCCCTEDNGKAKDDLGDMMKIEITTKKLKKAEDMTQYCGFGEGLKMVRSCRHGERKVILNVLSEGFSYFFYRLEGRTFSLELKINENVVYSERGVILIQKDDCQLHMINQVSSVPAMDTAFAYSPIRFSCSKRAHLKRNPLSISKLNSLPIAQTSTPRRVQLTSTLDLSSQSPQAQFCSQCATLTKWRVPEGDERHRHVCPSCGTVAFENPKIVVGCVPVTPDGTRVLLVKRAIPPVGKWTIPAGFLELNETAHGGAAREAWEEAYAQVDLSPLSLLAVYNILPAKQVQLVFRATLLNENDVKAGIESLEVGLFPWDDMPDESLIAFETVKWALRFARENNSRDIYQPDLRTR